MKIDCINTEKLVTMTKSLITEGQPLETSHIKFIIDVVEANGPEFLINSDASLYRKNLILKTWLDKDERLVMDTTAKNFFESILESTLNDDSIDDDIAEEICKCLSVGFNLRLFLYKHNEFLSDINKIKQITYAVENYVSLAEVLDEKGDSITMEELLKFRLDKQNEVYLKEKKEAEDEVIESESTNEVE